MTVQTKVVWNVPMDPAILTPILDRAQELADEGKQVDTPLVVTNDTIVTAVRWWIDHPTALEWVTFCETYNPVSAEIVN